MRIIIEFIPEEAQRYATQGDWVWKDGDLHIFASGDTPNDAFLIGLHEMVEAWLCRDKGVPQEAVDAFDLAFIAEDHPDDAEPGDDPRAPYRIQHRQSMMVEHLAALFLGITDYGTVS